MSGAAKRIGSVSGKTAAPLLDLRFARLLGPDDWARLPPAIRRRFSKHITPDCEVHYDGLIEHTTLNLAGRALAQLLRLIGAPLPLDADNHGQRACVSINEARDGSGQRWTRRYDRTRARRPQTITSTKSFAGRTGCAEWVTPWLGMELGLRAEEDALYFESRTYCLKILGRRVVLPRGLSPGTIRVGHHHIRASEFRFTLTLTHPLFGRLVDQAILFRDGD